MKKTKKEKPKSDKDHQEKQKKSTENATLMEKTNEIHHKTVFDQKF